MKMLKKYLFVIISLLSMLVGCRIYDLKSLTIDNNNNSNVSSILKTHGYYYCEYIDSSQKIKMDIYFPYADGSILNMGSFSGGEASLKKHLESLSSRELMTYKRLDHGWGMFKIDASGDMTIQTAAILSSGGAPILIGIIESKGMVINDSTFTVTQNKNPVVDRNNGRQINTTFKFKQFHPKPDSTNWLKRRLK